MDRMIHMKYEVIQRVQETSVIEIKLLSNGG